MNQAYYPAPPPVPTLYLIDVTRLDVGNWLVRIGWELPLQKPLPPFEHPEIIDVFAQPGPYVSPIMHLFAVAQDHGSIAIPAVEHAVTWCFSAETRSVVGLVSTRSGLISVTVPARSDAGTAAAKEDDLSPRDREANERPPP